MWVGGYCLEIFTFTRESVTRELRLSSFAWGFERAVFSLIEGC